MPCRTPCAADGRCGARTHRQLLAPPRISSTHSSSTLKSASVRRPWQAPSRRAAAARRRTPRRATSCSRPPSRRSLTRRCSPLLPGYRPQCGGQRHAHHSVADRGRPGRHHRGLQAQQGQEGLWLRRARRLPAACDAAAAAAAPTGSARQGLQPYFNPEKVAWHHAAQTEKREKCTYPWTLLVMLSGVGHVSMYPWPIANGQLVKLHTPHGCAVLFRGDVLHAGRAYPDGHTRAH